MSRSRNQALEGGCFNHLSSLLDRPTPDFLVLSLSGGEDTKRNLKHVGYLFSLVKARRKLLT
jgi:hypothetical protein